MLRRLCAQMYIRTHTMATQDSVQSKRALACAGLLHMFLAGISAAVAVINMVVTLASPAKEGTVVEVCNDCCVNCASALKEPEGPRIGDCTSEDCLCAAAGPGVTANIFDRTCSTYFHW